MSQIAPLCTAGKSWLKDVFFCLPWNGKPRLQLPEVRCNLHASAQNVSVPAVLESHCSLELTWCANCCFHHGAGVQDRCCGCRVGVGAIAVG